MRGGESQIVRGEESQIVGMEGNHKGLRNRAKSLFVGIVQGGIYGDLCARLSSSVISLMFSSHGNDIWPVAKDCGHGNLLKN